MPKISIIVPVYNAEKYLSDCLSSLLNQSFPDIEVLCINDGSTDSSGDILNRFQQTDSRVKVFHQKNAGPAKARNVGLQNAQGKYLMFCDSDDTYEPNMCKEMYRTITLKQVDVVMCNTNVWNKNLEPTKNSWLFPVKAGKYNLTQQMISRVNVFLWNKIFRVSVIRQFGIDFPDGFKSDDNLFIYKYLMSVDTIYLLNKKLYNHFERENSIMDLYYSQGIKKQDLYDKSDIMAFLWDYLTEHGLWDKNKEAFLNRFREEFVFSWMRVPDIWEKDFFEHFSKNVRHIGWDNIKYQNEKLQLLFEVLKSRNFYMATKIADDILRSRGQVRCKYTFQKNPQPIFPKQKTAIVFNCDDRYVPYFSVALQSVKDNSSSNHFYDIVLLNNDITDENRDILKRMISDYKNISLRFFNMQMYEKLYQISEYSTMRYIKKAAYYRLFIPKIFESYERVVYLDSDLVVHADIENLATVDLKDHACGAVVDFGVSRVTQDNEMSFKGIYDYGQKVLNFTNWKSYFNSGVMVYNIPKMIQKDYFSKFVQVAKINNRFFNDQNVLNAVLQKDVLLLNDSWNMQMNNGNNISKIHLLPISQIKILHFCCPEKPWKNPKSLFADIWWHYARKSPFYELILKENLSGSNLVGINPQTIAILNHPIYYRIKKLFYKLKKSYGNGKHRDKYYKKYMALKQAIKSVRKLKFPRY